MTRHGAGILVVMGVFCIIGWSQEVERGWQVAMLSAALTAFGLAFFVGYAELVGSAA